MSKLLRYVQPNAAALLFILTLSLPALAHATAYIVDNDDDNRTLDGAITLREAIEAANTNASVGDAPAGMAGLDTITFAPALNGATIMLAAGLGELDITEALSITDPVNATPVTVDGGAAIRIFDADADLTLSDVTLQNGNAGSIDASNDGGCLRLGEVGGGPTATVTDVTFDGCSGFSGGAIDVNIGATLNVESSDFTGNSAVRAGGAIEHNGDTTTLTVTDSNASDNSAGPQPGNGGFFHTTAGDSEFVRVMVTNNSATSEGGGLWNNADFFMAVIQSTVSGNVASGDDATQGGGGLFNNGGSVQVDLNSVFSGNVANGVSGSGGGIFNNSGGQVVVIDSSITGNTANRAGGGLEENSGTLSGLRLMNATLDSNSAGIDIGDGAAPNPGNGGGLHVTIGGVDMIGGTASNNVAASEGGGLWNNSGFTMTLDGVTVADNVASGDDSTNGGGGLFNAGGFLTIENGSSIINNRADGVSGSGGGIFNDSQGITTIRSSAVVGNTANRAGGGIEENSGQSPGIVLQEATLDGNSAGVDIGDGAVANPGNGGGLHVTAGGVSMTGGTVSGNVAASEGGGLWHNADFNMSLNGGTVANNVASGDDATNGGGGVFNNGGTVRIFGSTSVTGNRADGISGSGGGLFNDTGGLLYITGATITGNTANRAGGGIEENSGVEENSALNLGTLLQNTTLDNNSAGVDIGDGAVANPGNGGGLHVTAGSIRVTGGTVSGNQAALEGGGLWNNAGFIMEINGATVASNVAAGAASDNGGGGIFNNGGDLIVRSGSTLAGNSANGASGSGGGIMNDGGTVTVTDSQLTGNSANRAGGGIEDLDGGGILVMNSTLDTNTTGSNPGNGGGIHITGGGTLDVALSDIMGNSAINEGGGLWNSAASTMTLTDTSVTGNTSPIGGGVFNDGDGGLVRFERSTASGNTATGTTAGGGLASEGGTLEVINATVSSNAASGGVLVSGGTARLINVTVVSNGAAGLTVTGGDAQIGNSIFADNTGADIVGTVSSLGYNLIENNAMATVNGNTTGNQTGVDPQLGPLADNGGPTMTHLQSPTSPVIDAGADDLAISEGLAIDQRGEPRYFDATDFPNTAGVVDVGAVEQQNPQGGGEVVNPIGGDVLEIPTLDQYGLMLMMLLLGAFAWRRISAA